MGGGGIVSVVLHASCCTGCFVGVKDVDVPYWGSSGFPVLIGVGAPGLCSLYGDVKRFMLIDIFFFLWGGGGGFDPPWGVFQTCPGRVLKGVQKKFFAPKKKKKKIRGGAKNIFAPPQKKKKSFFGRKFFFEGGFQTSAGILWLFVSTTTDTAKHHSVAVTLTMCESGARDTPCDCRHL